MTEALHQATSAQTESTQIADFAHFAEAETGERFGDYRVLYAFSIAESDRFWSLFLRWSGVLWSGELAPTMVGSGVEDAKFFPNVRLSWAENMLSPSTVGKRERLAIDATAIVSVDETGKRVAISREDLRKRVRAVAAALEMRGLREGDRVAAVARNTLSTVVACLAVTALGATWSSVAPDMGLEAALARFGPLNPKFLFVHEHACMNGQRIEVPVSDLGRAIRGVEATISLDMAASAPTISMDALEREGHGSAFANGEQPWRRFRFDHPLFILFSSGTTGAPKGIVHGHGGTLLEHLKEHRLHCDLGAGDRLCFQTSTGWMMWNWTVSALASGAGLVLYDGSVSHPERDAFLRVAKRERVTVLGTSPAYLQYLRDAGVTCEAGEFPDLREIECTGSVLGRDLHRWAKDHVSNVPLQSISGGTDILGCFVMGTPWMPVYAGEASCVGLGMDLRVWDVAAGATNEPSTLPREGTGELVCARPFPSRPVAFLADADGARLHETYFAQHPGVWTHGDLVDATPRGTVRVLGRCDGTLKIRGIRIGPSEIYDVLASAVPEVHQAMAVDTSAPDEPGGKRLVLFVKLRSGVGLDRALTLRIKKELKERASPAHVPGIVVEVDELPATFSGKLSEAAMQDALNGRPVRNRAALRNPAAIDKAVAALLRQAS